MENAKLKNFRKSTKAPKKQPGGVRTIKKSSSKSKKFPPLTSFAQNCMGMPTVTRKSGKGSKVLTEEPTNLKASSDLPIVNLTGRRSSSESSTAIQTSGSEKENSLVSRYKKKRKLETPSTSEALLPPQKKPRLSKSLKKIPKSLKMEEKPNRKPQHSPKGLDFDGPKGQNGYRRTKSTSKLVETRKLNFRKTNQKTRNLWGNARHEVNGSRFKDHESNRVIKHKAAVVKKYPQSLDERQIYAQMTNLPMDKDHKDEAKTLDWVIEAHKRLLDDFIDVNPGEKKLMFLWNIHTTINPCFSKRQMVYCLKDFIEEFSEKIWSENLYRNFLLHLSQLASFGIITPQCMAETVIAIQEKFRLFKAVEKGIVHHDGNVRIVATSVSEPNDDNLFAHYLSTELKAENNNLPTSDKLCKEDTDPGDKITRTSNRKSNAILTNG